VQAWATRTGPFIEAFKGLKAIVDGILEKIEQLFDLVGT
jgi:hypothetical protein